MLHNLGRARRLLLRVLDLFALAVALPLACAVYRTASVRPDLWIPSPRELALPAATALLLWTAAAWFHELYEGGGLHRGEEIRRAMLALGTVLVGFLAFVFAAKATGISRLLIGLYFALAATLLALARVGCDAVARAVRRRGYRLRYYAVVGCGELAHEIVATIAARREWGLNLAGFVADGDETPASPDCVLLGTLDDLGRILEEHVLDEVIFAVPRTRLPAVEAAILLCEEQGVAVRISLDVLRYGRSPMRLTWLDGLPMLAFSRTPSDLLALATKRAFDVTVSAAVLVLLSPLLALVALAIKLDSPGPVLFRQRRVGLNGHPFQMLKFRSMHLDAEARLESLRTLNEVSGPVFKMRDDPRVTRVGRFIRKTSLDEFPQFWNVLVGEMSVVGPRPPIPAEVRKYKRWQRRRLSVRPGITCTWQISGRSDIDFDRWMELDLEYIDGWSLTRDLMICLKTIPAVLSARGAH